LKNASPSQRGTYAQQFPFLPFMNILPITIPPLIVFMFFKGS
jgi:hypothetical protein